MENAQTSRVLGTFSLAMITVAAIISLRNLPLSAMLGFSAIFFLVVAALTFFIPISLVTAELAAGWPRPGGCYVWVSEALGKRWGFVALWIAWMETITWFPAILIFTAAMCAHMLAPVIPGLEHSKLFMFIVVLGILWGTSLLNFVGLQVSGWVSSFGVIAGTLIPGILVIGLGSWWILTGKPSEIPFTVDFLLPNFDLDSTVLFSGILLSLAGVELAVFHIREAKNPQRNYPIALFLAAIIIIAVYILGTLAIACVVPTVDIDLASGLVQAYKVFFSSVGWSFIVPFLAMFLLLGSLAGINAWTIGPAKGMLTTANDGFLPNWLRKVNNKQVPTSLLLVQAILVSIFAVLFLYLGSSATIWILTALSAQCAMIQYVMVLISALILRKSQPNTARPYRVKSLTPIAVMCILSCIFGFCIVFITPNQFATTSQEVYITIMLVSLVLLILPALLLASRWQTRLP